jgi:hypothetical protein
MDKLEVEKLHAVLRYDAETGLLFWCERPASMFPNETHCKVWNSRFAGKEAFCSSNPKGYKMGGVFGRTRTAHRVVWAMIYGEWPNGQIDHINGNPADNRIENLRCVCATDNARNAKRRRDNTTGQTGVIWAKERKRWNAFIKNKGRRVHLGLYDRFEDAVAARKHAERLLGYHPNHGRNAHA